jgi:DNA-binding CsgD family transcriptional regulator
MSDSGSAPFQDDGIQVLTFEQELAMLTPAEQAVYATRMATDPPRTSRECGRVLGKSHKVVEKHWGNIKTKLARDPLASWKQRGLVGQGGYEDFDRLRNVSNDTLIKLAEMRMEGMLRAITKEKLEKATVKELSASIRDLSTVRQIQKGEPTQILQVNQRENLKRLFPMAVKELARRGYSIELGGQGFKVVQQIEAEAKPAEAEGAE